MVAVLATLLFSAAFAASIWAIFVTIEPRLGYMRALLKGGTVPGLVPATAPRVRAALRPAAVTSMAPRAIRAVA